MPNIRPEDGPDRSIFIGLDTEEPIDATELGLLLRDLAKDYKRATGGRLVVSRLETGSLDLWLQDYALLVTVTAGAVTAVGAAVVMASDATKRMTEFAKSLKTYLEGGEKALPSDYQALAVAISGERLVDLAANHGANVRFKELIDGSKRETELVIKFPDVERMRDRNKKDKQRERAPNGQKAIGFDMARLLSDGTRTSDELEALISAIVSSAKKAGHIDMIAQMATDLESAGRTDIAKVIRRFLPKPDRRWGFLPPPDKR